LLADINRQEITPPVGIYGRMWGASNHDQSEANHQPLYVTALACIAAGKEAIAQMAEAILAFGQGSCSLAAHRDFPEPNNPKRYLTDFNPEIKANDTLLVGRVTRVKNHKILGTLVNYACHPTSLGWDNKLISPYYVGRMFEMIERKTGGAPYLFLQETSRDLAPAHQYEGVTNVTDQAW
jgi:hypothetical protein